MILFFEHFCHQRRQSVEGGVHLRMSLFDPTVDRVKGVLSHTISPNPSDFLGDHDAAFLKDAQVLENSGQAHIGRRCQFLHGSGSLGQLLDKTPSIWIGESVEYPIEAGRGQSVHRYV